ncbi:TadE/TadG family type IV pilus assembly protein [Ruegeria lacuscaerulensis]|uniref:TadE/TadG family type IV pilus assembly protein n=1 Tax=Ruegeria lacuscaerulensis TaxID=55218 RepID=UPI00147ADC59|nr:pilus assembly protein [Ruegeria lacuscaerulensis]
MSLLAKVRNLLNRKARDERGALSVEAVLVFPMLFWTVTGTYTFFDGFRQSAANLRAAYTVGDLISRETSEVTDTYVDSMQELMERMVDNGTPLRVRISLVRYDEGDARHYVDWSAIRGFCDQLDNDNITSISGSLPPMPDQDTLIIVETSNDFDPAFGGAAVIGDWVSDDSTFENFVFTRPRFTNAIAQNLGPQPVCS